jgi:hypothetical protein
MIMLLVENRNSAQAVALLNVAHSALVTAFRIPKGNRYEVVDEHSISHLVMHGVRIGIAKSGDSTLVQVTTRPRSHAARRTFHRLLCEGLAKECGIAPSDVIVSMVATAREDRPFNDSRTQFLTGKLEGLHPNRVRSSAARSRCGRSRVRHLEMASAA